MDVFLKMLPHLLPLYGLIGLGYIAGRFLNVNLQSIAKINLYILLPLVSMGAMVQMQFQTTYILLPFIMLAVSVFVSFAAYHIFQKIWTNGTQNLIAAAGVNGNALYFGLPIALMLFGPTGVAIYIFMNLGPAAMNATRGYYLVARGKFGIRESTQKLIRFPLIYGMLIGGVFNAVGVEMHEITYTYWEYATGATVFLGMMMIGIALAKLDKLEFDWGEQAAFICVKFLFWPLSVLAFIAIDKNITHLFDGYIYQMMLVFSVMPIMGNLVAYAAEHNLYPEKAASAVLVTSLATAIVIPFTIWAVGL